MRAPPQCKEFFKSPLVIRCTTSATMIFEELEEWLQESLLMEGLKFGEHVFWRF